jgi:hypothetical protein
VSKFTLYSLTNPHDPFGRAEGKEADVRESIVYENKVKYSKDIKILRENIIRVLWEYFRWTMLVPGQKPQALSSLVENLIDACLDWAEGK